MLRLTKNENKMKTKIISLLNCLFLYSILNAGEITGKIQLKENGKLRVERGEIFFGEVNLNDEQEFKKFPPYLTAMIDSLKNQRIVKIDENGEFLIKDVPLNKKIIIGVSFSGMKFFIHKTLSENNLKFDKIIDLDSDSISFDIGVENKTGIVFNSEFSSMSYLIEEGSEGRVFTGKKSDQNTVKFGVIPIGNYKVYLLNEVEENKPNRVDVMAVEIKKDDEEPVVFEVK